MTLKTKKSHQCKSRLQQVKKNELNRKKDFEDESQGHQKVNL